MQYDLQSSHKQNRGQTNTLQIMKINQKDVSTAQIKNGDLLPQVS